MESRYGKNQSNPQSRINTLDVWFDDPKKEFICEETGEEIVLKKRCNYSAMHKRYQ